MTVKRAKEYREARAILVIGAHSETYPSVLTFQKHHQVNC